MRFFRGFRSIKRFTVIFRLIFGFHVLIFKLPPWCHYILNNIISYKIDYSELITCFVIIYVQFDRVIR